MFEKENRVGLFVYLYYNRDARKIAKFGDLIYQSKRMRYLLLYLPAGEVQETVAQLNKLKYVKKVRVSELDTIDQNFVGNLLQLEKSENFEENEA
ncbi:DUF2129 domain-containing protein [Streptococcus caprae]|uniref:UPF0298 protein ACFORF_00540 n=1 Tax=Streptococcus caprae TaxID=1640501 RepID=A0ABV8CSN2_9STRE